MERTRSLWANANDWVAVQATRGFGTMPAFYLLLLYSLLPMLRMFHPYQDAFLYYSNAIQLIALPLLAVGTNLLGRAAEARADEDHQTLQQEFAEIRETHAEIRALVEELHAKVDATSE